MEPLFYTQSQAVFIWLFVALIISIVVALTAAGLSDRGVKNKLVNISIVIGGIGFLASLTGIIVYSFVSSNTVNSIADDRIKLIEDTYGVSVSEKVYEDLGYPKEAPVEGTFTAYGTANITIKQDREIEQTEVTLVWNETEFQLASNVSDSTKLEELPKTKGS